MADTSHSGHDHCCAPQSKGHGHDHDHDHKKSSFDYILWPSVVLIVLAYLYLLIQPDNTSSSYFHFAHSSTDLMNKMWWGLAISIVFVGWLGRIPREVIMGILGTNRGFTGLLRATLAGLLLDLCNHGILVVAMRLYERGASLGQTMAFLIASPWNSFSMTVILWSLIGLKYTLLFIVLSAVVALISGWIFELLVRKKVLPPNPHSFDLPQNINLTAEIKKAYGNSNWSAGNLFNMLKEGLLESRMILRWIFFGVVLAAGIQTVLPPGSFESFFGPTLMGLGLTMAAATVIEVCSEGSAPIAADLVRLAKAPGNGFTFLMTGVATDYTEIMSLRETTRSWKVALFLPLVTVPQVLIIGMILNWTA